MKKIKYKSRVHYFSFGTTYCNHVQLNEDEYHLTDEEVDCENCIELDKAWSLIAQRIADKEDEEILEIILN